MISILHLLSTKDSYNRYVKYIKKHIITKEVYTVIQDMRIWYKSHDHVEWEKFAIWFKLVRHASMLPESLEIYDKMFESLEDYEPTGTDLEIVHTIIARDYATQIAEKAFEVADGKGSTLDSVSAMVKDYEDTVDKAKDIEDMFVTDDIHEIISTVFTGGGYNWRLNELNKSLGPLRVGDFITFSARPDTGKTTLLASEVSFLTPQLPEDTVSLWFCNEEDGNKVKFRVLQSTLGISSGTFASNPDKHYDNYLDIMGGARIKVVHDSMMTVHDVDSILESYKGRVGLIILDQLWKIGGFEKNSTSDVDRQTKLFGWARSLSKQAPVLNVHQADASAHGELYIEMNQLYGSKTAIQGECDAIVTVGRDLSGTYSENTRGIYAPKNKLAGGPSVDTALKNAKFEVEIDVERARYVGVL